MEISVSMKVFFRKVKEFFIEFGKYILTAVVIFTIAILLAIFVFGFYGVDGYSMSPTFDNGDTLFVNKMAYSFNEPERNDIITFEFLYLKDTSYVKRIIGLPGETVQIIEGEVYINDELYNNELGLEYIYEPGIASEPMVLGEDEYFVLGDNRSNSTDSRSPKIAKVKKEQIIGKVIMRVFPLNKLSKY